MPAPNPYNPYNPYEYADLLEPRLRDLYLRLVKEARGRIPLNDLYRALASGKSAEAVGIVEKAIGAVNPKTVLAWRAAIEEIFGRTAISAVSQVVGAFTFNFNMFNPVVLDQIDAMVADRVVEVGADTRLAIKDVVDRGWVEGITPYNQARMIRSMVGPIPEHSKAAGRYLKSMREAGVPEDRAVYNAELYQNRLVNWRATVISRTENISAANAGRVAAWAQMAEEGLLEPDRMFLEWNVTDDDRLCPYCAPMDKQTIEFGRVQDGVRFGPQFVSSEKGYRGEPDRKPKRYDSLRPDPYGPQRDKQGRFIVAKALVPRKGEDVLVPYPPLHPNCRCDVRLIIT